MKELKYDKDHLYIAFDPRVGAVYSQQTNTFCATTPEVAQRMEKAQELLEEGVENSETQEFKEAVQQAFGGDEPFQVKEAESFLKTRDLYDFVVLVQNGCDLHCRYCFAEGGDYGLKSEHLEPEAAKEYIETFVRDTKVVKIESVKFFGGEPSAYPETIKACCDTFQKLYADGILKEVPQFMMVTNGTYYSKELSDLLVKNNFIVTFSLDGEAAVNDYLRPFKNGKGSFALVKQNILKFIADGLPKDKISIEATYTKYHMEKHIAPEEIAAFMKRELGIEQTMVMACTPCDCANNFSLNVKEYADMEVESAKKTCRAFLKGAPADYNADILGTANRFAGKEMFPLRCGIGFGLATLTPTGEIYPCYMLMDKAYRMGVYSPKTKQWDFSNVQAVLEKLGQIMHMTPDCESCWARDVCFYCPTKWQYKLNLQQEGTNQKVSSCVLKAFYNQLLLEMSALSLNERAMSNFCSRLIQKI